MTDDDALVAALRKDWRSADLTEPERAMLGYADQLTRSPAGTGPADLDGLRTAGFDETAILQITLIASFFNYINRAADGLGVGRGEATA